MDVTILQELDGEDGGVTDARVRDHLAFVLAIVSDKRLHDLRSDEPRSNAALLFFVVAPVVFFKGGLGPL